jgi:hypothetical protein
LCRSRDSFVPNFTKIPLNFPRNKSARLFSTHSILDGRNFTSDGLENAWKKVQDSVNDDNVTNSNYLQPAYALQLPKTIQRPYLSNSLALRSISSGPGYLAAPVTDVFNPTEYSAVALRRKPALSSLRIADIPDDIVDRLRLLLGKYLQQSLIRCIFVFKTNVELLYLSKFCCFQL